MPIYDYKCLDCNYLEKDRFASMDETVLKCPECNGKHVRLLHARFGINMGVGAYGYYDDNLDAYISTNKQKRQVMEQQGVTPKGDSPKLHPHAWV